MSTVHFNHSSSDKNYFNAYQQMICEEYDNNEANNSFIDEPESTPEEITDETIGQYTEEILNSYNAIKTALETISGDDASDALNTLGSSIDVVQSAIEGIQSVEQFLKSVGLIEDTEEAEDEETSAEETEEVNDEE